MGRLDGKVAIVTGGVSGIGRRTAEAFVEEGARVYIGDVNEDGIGAMVSTLGHNYVDGMKVDIRDEDAVRSMVDGCVKRFGRLDVGFNNAGLGHFSPIQDYPADEFRRIIDVCLTGTMLCIKHTVSHMVAAGGGSFVGMSSIAGHLTHPYFGAYCAGKAAIEAMMRNAADEFGASGVRFNAIAPGFISTEIMALIPRDSATYQSYVENTPLGGVGEPEDVAQLARFLIGPESRWVTGTCIDVDGGHHLRRGPDFGPFIEPALGREVMRGKRPGPAA